MSRFTFESEVAALDTSLRFLTLRVVIIMADVSGNMDETMLYILKAGRNPTTRHLARTQRASVAGRKDHGRCT